MVVIWVKHFKDLYTNFLNNEAMFETPFSVSEWGVFKAIYKLLNVVKCFFCFLIIIFSSSGSNDFGFRKRGSYIQVRRFEHS